MNELRASSRTRVRLFIGSAICLLIGAPATCWLCGGWHSAAPAPASSTGAATRRAISAADLILRRPSNEPPASFERASFREIEWRNIADWRYSPTDPKHPSQSKTEVPDDILALGGKKVTIAGFMQPLDLTREGVKNFALVADQMGCCFAGMPRMNAWIDAKMIGDRFARFVPYTQVQIYGTFEVGEVFEDGYVASLYRMKVECVEPVE
jgi:hypothetical protein